MCEDCLMKSEINLNNSEAILALANAASALALNVGGSEAAIEAINARIVQAVKLPEPDKATEPAGQSHDDQLEPLPPQLRDLLSRLGIQIIGGPPPRV